MTTKDDWEDEFKGSEFESMTTEFHYHKLTREIDQVNDVKVLQDMLKQYIKIHLKEKELWKKLMQFPVPSINTSG